MEIILVVIKQSPAGNTVNIGNQFYRKETFLTSPLGENYRSKIQPIHFRNIIILLLRVSESLS